MHFSDEGEVFRAVLLRDASAVLSEGNVEHPVQPVLDVPVDARQICQAFGVETATTKRGVSTVAPNDASGRPRSPAQRRRGYSRLALHRAQAQRRASGSRKGRSCICYHRWYHFQVAKLRRGNYVFLTWKGDHGPRHVHVYRDGRLVLKWNLDESVPMKGNPDARLVQLIARLKKEGAL
jgi:hypothetical protein